MQERKKEVIYQQGFSLFSVFFAPVEAAESDVTLGYRGAEQPHITAAFTRSPLGGREVAMMDGGQAKRSSARPFRRVGIRNLKHIRQRSGALSAKWLYFRGPNVSRHPGGLMSSCGQSSPHVPRRRRGRDLSPLWNVASAGTRRNMS